MILERRRAYELDKFYQGKLRDEFVSRETRSFENELLLLLDIIDVGKKPIFEG